MRRKVKTAIFIERLKLFLFFFIYFLEKVNLMRESNFQADLKKELKRIFPGCIITKLDSGDIQGIPDLLILYKNKWATLECKKSKNESKRPNQEYYVRLMNEMSFSRFIYPENKEEVINELQQTFRSRRPTCFSGSK